MSKYLDTYKRWTSYLDTSSMQQSDWSECYNHGTIFITQCIFDVYWGHKYWKDWCCAWSCDSPCGITCRHGSTVEHPNNGHVGSRDLVLYREVVPTRRLATKPHPKVESIEECGLREIESVTCITSCWGMYCAKVQYSGTSNNGPSKERPTSI